MVIGICIFLAILCASGIAMFICSFLVRSKSMALIDVELEEKDIIGEDSRTISAVFPGRGAVRPGLGKMIDKLELEEEERRITYP